MIKTTLKCVQCGNDYIHERGKGARAINMAHLCGKCLNPLTPAVSRPVYQNPTVKTEPSKSKKG